MVVRDLKAQHERTQMADLGAGEDFGGVELLPLVWSGTSAKRQTPRRIGPVLFKTHHSTSTVNVVVGGFGACAGVEGSRDWHKRQSLQMEYARYWASGGD